jgi:hypothetical protein
MRSRRQMPSYPVLDIVLNAIADRVKRYRYASNRRRELAQCRPEEANAIARELGVSLSELGIFASKGPASSQLLNAMLRALRIDPHPRVVHDLHRLCMACVDKIRCERELAAGTAVKHFREFCPNAATLDALLSRETVAPRRAS